MMHKQIIPVSMSWHSFLFRSAVFNSGLNKEKKDDNEKPRYTRLMKLDKEDGVG